MTRSFAYSAAVLAALVGVTMTTAALAEKGPMGGPMGGMMMNFEQLDADKDGKVTKEEGRAAMQKMMQQRAAQQPQ